MYPLGITVAFTASSWLYYILGNYGHARSQDGRHTAAAKPPLHYDLFIQQSYVLLIRYGCKWVKFIKITTVYSNLSYSSTRVQYINIYLVYIYLATLTRKIRGALRMWSTHTVYV